MGMKEGKKPEFQLNIRFYLNQRLIQNRTKTCIRQFFWLNKSVSHTDEKRVQVSKQMLTIIMSNGIHEMN